MNTAEAPGRKKVLFLCTGNSCRSQMAEAIVNAWSGRAWEASSAGSRPAGFVHPAAIQVLAEIGIDAHGARSKPVSEFRQTPFDLVVTVCAQAAGECPVWMGVGKRMHLGYPDPAKAQGDDLQILEAFRSVRDAMLKDIPALLDRLAVDQPG
jgi:arsenate reductase